MTEVGGERFSAAVTSSKARNIPEDAEADSELSGALMYSNKAGGVL